VLLCRGGRGSTDRWLWSSVGQYLPDRAGACGLLAVLLDRVAAVGAVVVAALAVDPRPRRSRGSSDQAWLRPFKIVWRDAEQAWRPGQFPPHPANPRVTRTEIFDDDFLIYKGSRVFGFEALVVASCVQTWKLSRSPPLIGLSGIRCLCALNAQP
jgi:hypothetical protein